MTSGGRGRVESKSFDRPDDTRRFSHGVGTFVGIGSLVVGRAVLEPGWRWSTDIKPAVATDLCEVHHLHVLVAGRMAFQTAGGDVHEFEANDVMDIPPGHDAWVVGDEAVVILDISGNVSDFGLPTSQARAIATMLMSDIVDSTTTASRLGDTAWKQSLADHNRVVRNLLERFRGREVNTTGDGFLATFQSAGAALRCALEVRGATQDLGLEIRVGIHTGEIEILRDDVQGIAVHATARIMAAAQPSEILTSAVTRALSEGTGLQFVDRGSHTLKGIVTPLELFAVEGNAER